MSELFEMLSFPFMYRALIAGSLISLCAALLGVSLVLKRYSMIGDGLSHVGFGAMALAAALGAAPLAVALPVVILAAFLLLRLGRSSSMNGDAAIAVVSAGSLAIGVMLITVSGGGNVDLMNYMFGSILGMSVSDLWLSVALAAVVLVVFIFLYSKIFAVTFDESFAVATGVKTGIYNTVLAVLTAVTVVLGMRLVGALLISSLIIFPALSSMRLFKSFKGVVISSAVSSVICLISGMMLSYFFSLPAGACIICVELAVLIVAFAAGRLKQR